MNFVQSCCKNRLELTNELADKEAITGLDGDTSIGILSYRMKRNTNIERNVDNSSKEFSLRSTI